MTTETRELTRDEFYLAEKLWEQYRGQKAEPVHERIFGVFVDGDLAATARYTKHRYPTATVGWIFIRLFSMTIPILSQISAK